MTQNKNRLYSLYGDSVEVVFVYDEQLNRHIGEYPDFDEYPRTTPCGRRWVNATKDNCPLSDNKYGDCGSCEFYRCEREGDLIGVCENEKLRKEEV